MYKSDLLVKPYSSGQTVSRDIAGTTNYMSPEICVGGGLTNKSDLYTLGIIIYELISVSYTHLTLPTTPYV